MSPKRGRKFHPGASGFILNGMRQRAETPVIQTDPVIEAYKREVDRDQLRANLARTPEQRLLQLMELQAFADELKRRGRREVPGTP